MSQKTPTSSICGLTLHFTEHKNKISRTASVHATHFEDVPSHITFFGANAVAWQADPLPVVQQPIWALVHVMDAPPLIHIPATGLR